MHTKRLRDVPLFAKLGKRELAALALAVDQADVEAGEVLATEGDYGREFFVIDTGCAEVTRGEAHVADLGPGDFFGEIALIEEERRTATVTAKEPSTVLVLTAAAFRGLRYTAPGVYERVQAEIAHRRQPAVST